MVSFTKLHQAQRDIDNAENYQAYMEACQQYDQLSGNEDWKLEDTSNDYDYQLIRKRLKRIREAKAQNDVSKLMYILHEGIHGNLGNIANPVLYERAKSGTKYLIKSFLDEICDSLDYIYACDSEDITFYDKLFFFEETSHAYGQTCLMLSGGAGLGFFHCGVVKTLLQEGLLPNVISGASAGSIITSMLGTRTDDELKEILNAEYIYERFKNWGKLSKLSGGSILDSTNLENSLIEMFDLVTFEEAFKKTGRNINVTVSPADIHQQARMLNAKTSPNAVITQAVRASCAIPYLFEPVQLKAKDDKGNIVPYVPNRKFADGSIMADMPINRLARLYGVNHSIVSQTNPLAVPFLSRSRKKSSGLLATTGRHLAKMAKENSIFVCDLIESALPNSQAKLGAHKVRAIIDQQYVGDVNILPPRNFSNFRHILTNPSLESIRKLILQAERATWPQIEMIRNTTQISRTFHKNLQLLRAEETEKLTNPARQDNVIALNAS